MVSFAEWRRATYKMKIKEAEERAAKATDEEAAIGFREVAEGYRALLRRLEPREPF